MIPKLTGAILQNQQIELAACYKYAGCWQTSDNAQDSS